MKLLDDHYGAFLASYIFVLLPEIQSVRACLGNVNVLIEIQYFRSRFDLIEKPY